MEYWKITPGQGGYHWREQKLNECIAMGWSETKSLKGLSRDVIRSVCSQEHFSKSAAKQLNAFVNLAQIGDKVIASTSGKGVYAVGTIIGDYEFNEKLEYKHSRKVRWETTF
jgi:predicted Mrr-cat superfamily restriction endonuclease